MNPWLKCVILLRTKREEKLPHDNIPTSCCSKSIAAVFSHVCPQCILGPALSAFLEKLDIKEFHSIFMIYAGSENESTEISPDQPGMHMPQSSSINSAVPNKTSIRQFQRGIDLLIAITPGIIKKCDVNTGMKTTSFIFSRDRNNVRPGLSGNGAMSLLHFDVNKC